MTKHIWFAAFQIVAMIVFRILRAIGGDVAMKVAIGLVVLQCVALAAQVIVLVLDRRRYYPSTY